MEKPLYIPPNKKLKGLGLVVYCRHCKSNIVGEVCKETGKPLKRCSHGDKYFKVIAHVAGVDNVRRTKKLDTRDLNEAIKQAIEFKKEVKENTYTEAPITDNRTASKKEVENTPRLLINALARYIGFLKNEGVPAHRKKERSNPHISDVNRAVDVITDCLIMNGYDTDLLTVDEINDSLVGHVYEYLLNEKKFANRTFNKYFSYYTSFLKWYIEEYNIPIRNWFERVKRKKINSNPESITKDEYDRLLEQITPENGIRHYEEGVKLNRNVYRSWLKNGIRLALETGRRREEVINLKFDQIADDGNGNSLIKVEDYKVNRIQGRISDNEKKYIFIPVTDSLRELLKDFGYEKDKSGYILAPEVEIGRNRIMSDVLSRGFSHYFNQISDRKLTFKSLRKTYITGLSIYMGGNAKAITQHSNEAVIEKHYLDKQALAKAAQGFSVFSKEGERKNEIDTIRTNALVKQKNVDIEK